jgi:hypothetical protein
MSSVLAGDDSIFNNSRFKRYFFKLSAGSSGYFGGGTTRERKLEGFADSCGAGADSGVAWDTFLQRVYAARTATNTTPVAEDTVEVVSSYMRKLERVVVTRDVYTSSRSVGLHRNINYGTNEGAKADVLAQIQRRCRH